MLCDDTAYERTRMDWTSEVTLESVVKRRNPFSAEQHSLQVRRSKEALEGFPPLTSAAPGLDPPGPTVDVPNEDIRKRKERPM